MYQVPLRFIKVGQNMAICATRVVAIMSTDSHQARVILKNQRAAGTMLNASGNQPTKTIIVLDNGSVIASPLSIQRIMTAIDKSGKTDLKKSHQIKVYQYVPDLEQQNNQQIGDDSI